MKENNKLITMIIILLSLVAIIFSVIVWSLNDITYKNIFMFVTMITMMIISFLAIKIIYNDYKDKFNKIKAEYDTKAIELVNNTRNQLIDKDHECNKKVHSVEKEYNNLLINNIFDLYQAALVIRKYNIHKYEIDIRNNVVHVYCTMQTYTKMSIGKEILPNIKYHINGTNVIL